jgi:hypothetical protein
MLQGATATRNEPQVLLYPGLYELRINQTPHTIAIASKNPNKFTVPVFARSIWNGGWEIFLRCSMLMAVGQVYRCQNRACNCEVIVSKPSIEGAASPRCSCGAEMKKPYIKPALRELHPEEELLVRKGVTKN